MRLEDDNEGYTSARWTAKKTWKVGNSLLLELEKLEDRRQQKLQKTTEGALSVELYYSANILRRQVVAKVGSDNNAQTTYSEGSIQVAEGSKTMHKLGSNKLYIEDL